MKYTFQHYMDISTSASSVNILKIKAGGEYVRSRCKHLFSTYKYWKLGKISVKLIPASTLPVDPLGLSYSDDDPNLGVDPRDQLSPGLVRITNGEPIMTDLTGLSDQEIRQMYTNTLLDPRWSKFMLQSGFSRTAVPLAWDIGNLKQTVYPDMMSNVPSIITDKEGNPVVDQTVTIQQYFNNNDSQPNYVWHNNDSSARGTFQLGHKKRLGWLPTDAYEKIEYYPPNEDDAETLLKPMLNPIPEIECITVILPKAYKTRYYYRLFITETVYFSGIKNVGIGDESQWYEYRAFDNFTFAGYPLPCKPSEWKPMQQVSTSFVPQPPNDGGS